MKKENEPPKEMTFLKKFQEENGVRSGSLPKDKTEAKAPLHGSYEVPP